LTLRTRFGIDIEIDDRNLVIHSQRDLRILSSAILNGGLRRSKTIINHHVPKDFKSRDPERYLRQVLRKKDFDQNAIGLMTAADVRNASILNCTEFPFSLVVTAGVSNAMTAGDHPKDKKTDTINMIILLDSNPTDGCLVEIVKTTTEAKVVALREMDILSHVSKRVATGTSTDTVTVACTSRGDPVRYAGTGTTLGSTISRYVIRAVMEAVEKQERINSDRPIIERLKERGIRLRRLTKIVSERLSAESAAGSIQHSLRASTDRVLQRTDIASMVLAFQKMCEDAITSRTSARVAKAAGKYLAYLIGGNRGRSEFQKVSSNWKHPATELIVEGIVSGVVGDILERSLSET
jgi:adenosylcobinamide amidohydrolase